MGFESDEQEPFAWTFTDDLYGSEELHRQLYLKNGLFFHVMAAYVLSRQSGEPTSEDLLEVIADHFAAAINAKDEKTARICLGVGNEKDGGPGQWKRAKAQFKRATQADLVDQVKAVFGDRGTDKECFKFLSEIAGTTDGNLNQVYHEENRNKKGNDSE
jgi:hypothetical protein